MRLMFRFTLSLLGVCAALSVSHGFWRHKAAPAGRAEEGCRTGSCGVGAPVPETREYVETRYKTVPYQVTTRVTIHPPMASGGCHGAPMMMMAAPGGCNGLTAPPPCVTAPPSPPKAVGGCCGGGGLREIGPLAPSYATDPALLTKIGLLDTRLGTLETKLTTLESSVHEVRDLLRTQTGATPSGNPRLPAVPAAPTLPIPTGKPAPAAPQVGSATVPQDDPLLAAARAFKARQAAQAAQAAAPALPVIPVAPAFPAIPAIPVAPAIPVVEVAGGVRP
jgi:hypothetical protein